MKAPFRPEIDAMEGYTPGEQPRGGKLIKLNTNESPYPPSPKVVAAAREAAGETLRLYPDPMSTTLRETAARVYGFGPEQVLAGNGSDDLLTMLVRAFVPEGGLIATTRPTYTLYRTLATIQGASSVEIPFGEDWALPADALAGSGAQLVFVANPNSPSGTIATRAEIRSLAEATDAAVVVDEAYVDFSDEVLAEYSEAS